MTDGAINQVSLTLGRVEAEITNLSSQVERLNRTVGQLSEDHERMKNRGMGMLVGVGMVSSLGGAAIVTKVTKLMGW